MIMDSFRQSHEEQTISAQLDGIIAEVRADDEFFAKKFEDMRKAVISKGRRRYTDQVIIAKIIKNGTLIKEVISEIHKKRLSDKGAKRVKEEAFRLLSGNEQLSAPAFWRILNPVIERQSNELSQEVNQERIAIAVSDAEKKAGRFITDAAPAIDEKIQALQKKAEARNTIFTQIESKSAPSEDPGIDAEKVTERHKKVNRLLGNLEDQTQSYNVKQGFAQLLDMDTVDQKVIDSFSLRLAYLLEAHTVKIEKNEYGVHNIDKLLHLDSELAIVIKVLSRRLSSVQMSDLTVAERLLKNVKELRKKIKTKIESLQALLIAEISNRVNREVNGLSPESVKGRTISVVQDRNINFSAPLLDLLSGNDAIITNFEKIVKEKKSKLPKTKNNPEISDDDYKEPMREVTLQEKLLWAFVIIEFGSIVGVILFPELPNILSDILSEILESAGSEFDKIIDPISVRFMRASIKALLEGKQLT